MTQDSNQRALEVAFAEGFQTAQATIAFFLGVEKGLFERFIKIVGRRPARIPVPLSALAALRGLNDHPALVFGASEQEGAALDLVIGSILDRLPEDASDPTKTRH